jgi:hypothetical protein
MMTRWDRFEEIDGVKYTIVFVSAKGMDYDYLIRMFDAYKDGDGDLSYLLRDDYGLNIACMRDVESGSSEEDPEYNVLAVAVLSESDIEGRMNEDIARDFLSFVETVEYDIPEDARDPLIDSLTHSTVENFRLLITNLNTGHGGLYEA